MTKETPKKGERKEERAPRSRSRGLIMSISGDTSGQERDESVEGEAKAYNTHVCVHVLLNHNERKEKNASK